jgi:hypothetical protein
MGRWQGSLIVRRAGTFLGDRKLAYLTIALFCIWPFVNFADVNFWESLSYGRVAGIGLAFLGGTLIFHEVLAGTLFRGRRQGAAVYASIVFVAFFSFDIASGVAHSIWGEYHVRTWAISFLAACFIGFPIARLGVIQRIAPGVAVVMVALPAVQLSAKILNFSDGPLRYESQAALNGKFAQIPDIGDRRSIYLIIHDGYPRDDVLAQLGYDNTPFLDELRARGFFVPRDSHSNYESTNLTLTSLFDMDLAYDEANGASIDGVAATYKRIENGDVPIYKYFAAQGYSTGIIAMTAGNCNKAIDFCGTKFRPWLNLGQQDANLLKLTPLVALPSFLVFSSAWTYSTDFRSFVDSRRPRTPTFHYVHILDAHPPFIYDADCEVAYTGDYVDNQYVFGNEFYDALRCSNRTLLGAIDQILDRDSGAVIVITADHGSDFIRHAEERWSPEAFLERFAIFSAWRLPEECRGHLYETVTPVNTFRIVLTCLTGQDLGLAEDAAFFKAGAANGESLQGRVPVRLDRDTGYDVMDRLRANGGVAQ